MLMYENISVLYESISLNQWLHVSSPILAFVIYRYISAWMGNVIQAPAFLCGLLYCAISAASIYGLAHSVVLLLLPTVLYTAVVICNDATSFDAVKKRSCQIMVRAINITTHVLERHSVISTVILIAVFLSPPLFYTFDVTDSGHALSESMMVYHNGFAKAGLTSVTFLSYYFGGSITAVLDYFEIGLMGQRVAWVITFIFPIAVVIHIISRFFLTHWLLPFFGLAAAANIACWTKALDYESIPSFFAAIFLWSVCCAYRSTNARVPNYANVVISCSFVLLVLSRVTTISLGVALIVPTVILLRKPLHRLSHVRSLVVQLSSGFLAVGIFLALLFQHGSLGSYYESFVSILVNKNQNSDLHSAGSIVAIILGQIKDFFASQLAIVMLLMALILKLAHQIKSPYSFVAILCTITLLASSCVYGSNPFLPYTLATAVCSTLLVYGATLCWIHISSNDRILFATLSVMALLMPWAMSIGSYSGVTKLCNGVWLIIPLSLSLLLRFAQSVKPPYMKTQFLSVAVLLTAVLIASGFRAFHRYPYGDHYDRLAMTSVFSYPKLKGIHTTPGRQQSFQQLLEAIDLHRRPAFNTILAFNNIPMVYYASSTYPLFDEPWSSSIALSKVQNMADNLCSSTETTPGLIVRTKVETRSGTWGNNDDGPPIVEDIIKAKTKLDILDAGMRRCNPELIWENHDFQLFKPIFPG